MKTRARSSLLILSLAVLVIPLAAGAERTPAAAASWKLEPSAKQWSARGFAEALDLSGIAAIGARQCLVASDEMGAVQLGRIDAQAGLITAGELVPLTTTASGGAQEVDIEGVAVTPDGRRYFVTGSHGVGKKKGDVQMDRYAVFELPVDPVTGSIRRPGIRKASLRGWLEQSPDFGPSLYRPLQTNGLNIEGIAFAGGRLYFGLRGPNLDGNGHVIETDADAFFDGGSIKCVVHTLPLGAGRGVRDLVACRDGFIVVVGNASAEPSKKFPLSDARDPDARFELAWWQPGAARPLAWIGELPSTGGKAEALLVLEESASRIELLCLFDGAPDGGAVAYRLRRPASAGAAPAR